VVFSRYIMKKRVCIIVMMIAVFASAARAQQDPAERDPFHPPDAGFVSTAPVPDENAWGRDPFSNPLAGKVPTQKVPGREVPGRILTGIIFSTDVRLAIIGGDMLAEGSMVGDKKIVHIRSRSVVFETAAGGYEEVFLDNFSVGR
jgi:hypothetical protein